VKRILLAIAIVSAADAVVVRLHDHRNRAGHHPQFGEPVGQPTRTPAST